MRIHFTVAIQLNAGMKCKRPNPKSKSHHCNHIIVIEGGGATVGGAIKANFSCCGINYPAMAGTPKLNKCQSNTDVLLSKYIWAISGLLCVCVYVQVHILNWEKGHRVNAEAHALAHRELPWCPVPHHVFYSLSCAARGGREGEWGGGLTES